MMTVCLFFFLSVNDLLHYWLSGCFTVCVRMISFMLITQYYTCKMVTDWLSVFLSVCE